MKTLRDWIEQLPRGLDTPVLGELPMTADGVVIGHAGEIWTHGISRDGPYIGLFQSSMCECDDFSAESFDGHKWFSTREAAARAAKEGSD